MNKEQTEKYINEILADCNEADFRLGKVEAIAKKLVLPLCGHRETLDEAFEYVMCLAESSGKGSTAVMTAVGVLMNTIRRELEKAMKAQHDYGLSDPIGVIDDDEN